MPARTRHIRKPRTISIGTSKYRVGKAATRSVSKADGVKTVSIAKKGGGTLSRTVTVTNAEGKTGAKAGLGRYAKKHVVTNEDGSKTYTKKTGATVTKSAFTASEGAKPKRARS
jgi:hypothetical protein